MSPTRRNLASIIGALLAITACSRAPEPAKRAEAERADPPAKAAAPPAVFRVKFNTSKGPFVVEVHPEWAPLGAHRFRELIEDKYFNGARFFRVVPEFVVQFGLAASPAKTAKWDKAIKDDAVLQTNRAGALAFATMGPETRTAQIFINLRSNQSLDGRGFAPFALVVEGMNVVENLYSGYGEAPDQEAITKRGNTYLNSQFPKLDYIESAVIL